MDSLFPFYASFLIRSLPLACIWRQKTMSMSTWHVWDFFILTSLHCAL